VHDGLGSEGVAAAPTTVVSAVAEDAARAHLIRALAAKKADVPVVAAAMLPMSPDAVCLCFAIVQQYLNVLVPRALSACSMCSCRARSQPVRGQADCHFVGSRIVQSVLGRDTMVL
jgi:hypothetical protein